MTKTPKPEKPIKRTMLRLFAAAADLPFDEGYPVIRFLVREEARLMHMPAFITWASANARSLSILMKAVKP